MTTGAWRPSRSAQRKKENTDRQGGRFSAHSLPVSPAGPPKSCLTYAGCTWAAMWGAVLGILGSLSSCGGVWQTAAAGCEKGGGGRWETLNAASQLEVSIKFQCWTETRLFAASPSLTLRANQRGENGSVALANSQRRCIVGLSGLNGSKIEQNDSKLHDAASSWETLPSHFMLSLPKILPVPVCD